MARRKRMISSVFDDRACQLGEGPLWHPERRQLFWFDITACKMLSCGPDGPLEWIWDEEVSAAGWAARDRLLVASASGLWRFELSDGSRNLLAPLEADNPVTRSNDGRADPWGGFWIGTMGRAAEAGAGAIYRYFRGEMRRLVPGVTIPNAICFAPDRSHAYYADTAKSQVLRLPLDSNGWPAGAATVHIDLSTAGLNPDGAVTDAQGRLWIAQWGAGRVAVYNNGRLEKTIDVPAAHTTCPAFGGNDFSTLLVTSAMQGISDADLAASDAHGKTYQIRGAGQGRAEPQVAI